MFEKLAKNLGISMSTYKIKFEITWKSINQSLTCKLLSLKNGIWFKKKL